MVLNYRSLGQGPAIIILHGLFGSLDNWMSFAKQLAAKNTVYLVDLRNHGNSFHRDQFTYEAMSGDISQLVEHLNLNSFTILGHSMGGKAAMFYTASNETQVEKLIVVDIAPRHYPVRHQQILDGLSSIVVEELTSRNQADTILQAYISNNGIRQFLLKNLKRNASNSFDWKINLPVIRQQIENVGAGLPSSYRIQVPTLFIRGEHSDYITENDYREIDHQFKNASVETIMGAGHWVHAEAPAELFRVVRAFLD